MLSNLFLYQWKCWSMIGINLVGPLKRLMDFITLSHLQTILWSGWKPSPFVIRMHSLLLKSSLNSCAGNYSYMYWWQELDDRNIWFSWKESIGLYRIWLESRFPHMWTGWKYSTLSYLLLENLSILQQKQVHSKSYMDESQSCQLKWIMKLNKKAHGLNAQPLKDIILGSSPSVDRKLITHILTNVTNPPTHTHIWVGWLL